MENRFPFVQNTKNIIRDESHMGQLLGGTVILIIGIIIGAVLFNSDNIFSLEPFGYWTNFYTEMIGIGVTVFILNRLAERREVLRMKERLIRDAGSTSNETAKAAISELWKRGWLIGKGGLLQGADLRRANLTCANMRHANLKKANLFRAVLEDAEMYDVDLSNTDLMSAFMCGVDLVDADLSNAFLKGADLSDATLVRVNFSNANLSKVDMTGASLIEANLSGAILEGAIMPDGTEYEHGMDLKRFLDPNGLGLPKDSLPSTPDDEQ